MPAAEVGRAGLADHVSGARARRPAQLALRPALLDAASAMSPWEPGADVRVRGLETVPFHFIWISFTLVYGPHLGDLADAGGACRGHGDDGAAIGVDVARGAEPIAELTRSR